MIKVGDRVALIFHMSRTGKVVRLIKEKSAQWMVGGVAIARVKACVEMDADGRIHECKIEDLMRLD